MYACVLALETVHCSFGCCNHFWHEKLNRNSVEWMMVTWTASFISIITVQVKKKKSCLWLGIGSCFPQEAFFFPIWWAAIVMCHCNCHSYFKASEARDVIHIENESKRTALFSGNAINTRNLEIKKKKKSLNANLQTEPRVWFKKKKRANVWKHEIQCD